MINFNYCISLINTPAWGNINFIPQIQKKLYLNNNTVSQYLRVHYCFYTYKQLYAMSFLFFDNLAIVTRRTLLLQTIMSPHNDPGHYRYSGYLRISFITTCISYIFNILPVIFPPYLLVTTWIWSMKLSSLHNNLP